MINKLTNEELASAKRATESFLEKFASVVFRNPKGGRKHLRSVLDALAWVIVADGEVSPIELEEALSFLRGRLPQDMTCTILDEQVTMEEYLAHSVRVMADLRAFEDPEPYRRRVLELFEEIEDLKVGWTRILGPALLAVAKVNGLDPEEIRVLRNLKRINPLL